MTGDGGIEFQIVSAVLALGLAAVHLSTGRWEFVDKTRRRRFLSAGGGASVAYVFVLMLPEVAEAAAIVGVMREDALFAEQLVFLAALSGFVVFYGIEVLVTQRRSENLGESSVVYRVHILLFTLYSGLIGYGLFHQAIETLPSLVFYAVAMALHFGVTDYGFHRHYGAAFDTSGKVVLAGGTLVGAAIGFATELSIFWLAMLFGFVAGGLVFNVTKEELPDVTESRFVAFLAGAVLFTALALFA